ncbi:MAG TPA: hypothetical protein DEO85_16845 [Maritimibacter sp.]|nr:hypothetical protein [Maritimibacter sp.]HBZ45673.1 hypothetical protein [Maritimibacter sp.]
MTTDVLGAAIERLRFKFLGLLRQRLGVVRDCLDKDTPDADDLETALFVVHKVAGSAGTLDLKHLGDVARHCEESLMIDQQETGMISPRSRAELERFATFARAVLDTQRQLNRNGPTAPHPPRMTASAEPSAR